MWGAGKLRVGKWRAVDHRDGSLEIMSKDKWEAMKRSYFKKRLLERLACLQHEREEREAAVAFGLENQEAEEEAEDATLDKMMELGAS